MNGRSDRLNRNSEVRIHHWVNQNGRCDNGQTLDVGDDWMPVHLASDVLPLMTEVAQLRRWKAEAMPVLDGLQELGKALDLPLGTRITGPQAVEAVEALIAERDDTIGGRRVARLHESYGTQISAAFEAEADALAQVEALTAERDALLAVLASVRELLAPHRSVDTISGRTSEVHPVHIRAKDLRTALGDEQ